MGGGDLNLKKSWHPMLMSNQKRVWEEEQKALAERKKIDQMMKERAEERNLQELQQLQEAAGGTQRRQRVDWMYSGPSSGQAGTTEEMEGYLLGKRRIDGLIKGTENQQLQKSAKEDAFMAVQNANTLRDTAAKIREDPMLAIKRQEQAAYEAMMNDPVRRKILLKAAGQEDPERDPKRRKHHDHHRRRHRDANGEQREPQIRRSHSQRHDRGDKTNREERSPRRRHSAYSDEDRSHRRRAGSSASPPIQSRYYTQDNQRERRSRSRSRSPYRRKRAENGPRRSHDRPEKRYRDRRRSRTRSRSMSPSELSLPPSARRNNDDAAARLAAMQEDAQSLDKQRQHRLQQMAECDRAEDTRLDAERARNAKYGGRATFVDRMHKQAGDISLGDRLGRSGQRMIGEDD